MEITRRVVPTYAIPRNIARSFSTILDDSITAFSFAFLVTILVLAIVGPWIAPYGQSEIIRDADGLVMKAEGPSLSHPFGTTEQGYDVLSRLIIAARPTTVAGLLGGSIIISIGLSISLTSGYIGGRVDDVLMRFTDFMYGVPLYPFAIVMIAFFDSGYFQSILVIGLILWRGSARVLRSQVLQIRERSFIQAAKATGASPLRIMVKHIFPNIAPMAIFFFAMGIGYTILTQAGLVFLGITSPFIPSWGIMLRNAYLSGYMTTAWWWSLPPGLLISFTVLTAVMFGRRYEELAGQGRSEEALATGG